MWEEGGASAAAEAGEEGGRGAAGGVEEGASLWLDCMQGGWLATWQHSLPATTKTWRDILGHSIRILPALLNFKHGMKIL